MKKKCCFLRKKQVSYVTFLTLITAYVIKISLKYLYFYKCFQTCTALAQYRVSVSSRERVWGYRTCSLEIQTEIQSSPTYWKLCGQRASNNPYVALFSNVTVQNFSDLLRNELQRVSSLSLMNHEEINVQTIILCVNSPLVSSSVIVTQLIIFHIYIC